MATKLTQSPWFLKPGKVRQPPFLHYGFEFDERELAILALAARQADDVAALEAVLKREGTLVPLPAACETVPRFVRPMLASPAGFRALRLG